MPIREIAALARQDLNRPESEMTEWEGYAMDFVIWLQNKLKTTLPDREKTLFFETINGYQEIKLPNDAYAEVMVGTQVGRYVKPIAANRYLTSHLIQSNPFVVDGSLIWYYAPYWNNLGGYYGTWQTPANYGYGNGGDYGDYNIDWKAKRLYTAPTWRYRNIVVKIMVSCISPSRESCIDPRLYICAKNSLKRDFFANRGDWNNEQQWGRKAEKEFNDNITKIIGNKTSDMVKLRDRIFGYGG